MILIKIIIFIDKIAMEHGAIKRVQEMLQIKMQVGTLLLILNTLIEIMYQNVIEKKEKDCNEEHNYKEFCGYLSVAIK